MSILSPDFDAYVDVLTRRNRVSLFVLVGGMIGAVVFFFLYLAGIAFDAPKEFVSQLATDSDVPVKFVEEETNPLNLAIVFANLAVAAAVRVWYTRQDKMTTLLTHALVLEGESDTAIRVLLHKKMRK